MKSSIKFDLIRYEVKLTQWVFEIKNEFKNYDRENKKKHANRNNCRIFDNHNFSNHILQKLQHGEKSEDRLLDHIHGQADLIRSSVYIIIKWILTNVLNFYREINK